MVGDLDACPPLLMTKLIVEIFLYMEDPLIEIFLYMEDPLIEIFLYMEDPLIETFLYMEDPLIETFLYMEEPLIELLLFPLKLHTLVPRLVFPFSTWETRWSLDVRHITWSGLVDGCMLCLCAGEGGPQTVC